MPLMLLGICCFTLLLDEADVMQKSLFCPLDFLRTAFSKRFTPSRLLLAVTRPARAAAYAPQGGQRVTGTLRPSYAPGIRQNGVQLC